MKYMHSDGICLFGIAPQQVGDRLRCTIIFGSPVERYKERKLHDWPADADGPCWGPTLKREELVQCQQADGSLLVMIHAHSLAEPRVLELTNGVGRAKGRCETWPTYHR